MKGKNLAIVRGNLTDKPKMRYTKTKDPVAWFIIASNYPVRSADGSGWEKGVDYIPVLQTDGGARRKIPRQRLSSRVRRTLKKRRMDRPEDWQKVLPSHIHRDGHNLTRKAERRRRERS